MPSDGRPTFMDSLTEVGYRTHGVGKCHFTPNRDALLGFQTRETQEDDFGDGESDDYLAYLAERGFEYVAEPHGVRGEMYYVPQPSQVPARLHPTQWVGDRALHFIGEQTGDRPWYLFTGFVHPHPPFSPPSPWHKLYRATLMPPPKVPANSESLLTFVNRVQNRYKYRDQGHDTNLVRLIKAYYYACVSFIDYQVGRMVDALAERGVLDDTVILLSADHGELLGDYNCYGKRSMHDGASRVPLIVRGATNGGPSAPFVGGRRCDTPVSLVDIAPTLREIAGTTFDDESETDGVSLVRVLDGSARRESVFSHIDTSVWSTLMDIGLPPTVKNDPVSRRAAGSIYMAVSREWKYVYSAPDEREFLFDRLGDPEETRDRAGVSLCERPRRKMKAALLAHLRAGGETGGIDGDDWARFGRLRLPDNPDAGLLIQDIFAPGATTRVEGYFDHKNEE